MANFEQDAMSTDTSVIIRIVQEPLTAQNFTTIISALTELHTKCWLIEQGQFINLIDYTQTHDIRFVKEANLVIGKLAHNSPTLIDLILSSASIAVAIKIAIDAIAQAPLRYRAAKLENKRKELETNLDIQERHQLLRIAEEKAEQAKQIGQLQIDKQRLELQEQQLNIGKLQAAKQGQELDRQRLLNIEKDLESSAVEITSRIANTMVESLRPDADATIKAISSQTLMPNLLQLGSSSGLKLGQKRKISKKRQQKTNRSK